MKKITVLYKFFLFPLFISIITGCKQNQLMEYDDDAAIYFAHEQYGQQDSISHSFFILSPGVMRDTVYVKINTMGFLSDKDRPMLIEQVNTGDEDAAIAGVHYVAFDDPEVRRYMFVFAGNPGTNLPVILLRDKSLDLKKVRLHLKVSQNDYFRPGINEFREFLITTTAQAVKPQLWDSLWRYYFGSTWGSVKMRFIIDVTGYTEWEVRPGDMAYLNYMKDMVQQKLLEYNLAHPDDPLKEADGTLVVLN